MRAPRLGQGLVVVVCGGRAHLILPDEAYRLCEFHREHRIRTVLHGGARGVDAWAGLWATAHGLKVRVFRPNYDVPKAERRQAPLLRNEAMAREADAVIAFPGGRGTDRMVEAAERLGKPVLDWR
jgi:predicted Rossmann-fold nucleotide-binding protein